ncbi:MAG: hypothetical protein NC081_06825 [Roseburia sp.]|nr:hypothetical protein [Ruminococcus flavefaciens]MCM1569145.1 hypothetical protein [Roseburia sp.]
MENFVFKREYPKPEVKPVDEELNAAFHSQFSELQERVDNFSQKLPKIATPQWQQQYQDILEACDELVKQYGGEVLGEINYDDWVAHIDVTIPEFALFRPRDFEILHMISDQAMSLSVFPTEDGKIKIEMTLKYFAYIADGETETKFNEFASDFNKMMSNIFGLGTIYPSIEDIDNAALDSALDILQNHRDIDRIEAFREYADLANVVTDAKKIGEVVLVSNTIVFRNDSDVETPLHVTAGLSALTEILRYIINDTQLKADECFGLLMALMEDIGKVDKEMFFSDDEGEAGEHA